MRRNNNLQLKQRGEQIRVDRLERFGDQHPDTLLARRSLDISASRLAVRLATGAQRLFVRDGDVLFQQGQPAAGIYVVLEGLIKLSLESDDGDSMWSRTQGPGTIVGLPSCMSGRSYSLTATAIAKSSVVHVSRDEVQRLAVSDPEIGKAILELLSAEVFEIRRFLASITTEGSLRQ